MFRLTFQEYKRTYKSRLSAYLKEYEDNTPDVFFENELKTYYAFHNKLKFMVDNFDKNFEEEIKEGLNKEIYLTFIDGYIKSEPTYKPIPKPSIPQSVVDSVHLSILIPKPKTISKVKIKPITSYTKEELKINLEASWDSACNEDYIKSNVKKIYNNIITSTKKIIDFINNEKSNHQNSVASYIKIEAKDSSISKDHLSIKTKKFSEKWHALAYLLELKAKGLKPPINTEGTFIKSELESIGRSKTRSKGQVFYRTVRQHYKDLDKPDILNKSFGKDWKDTILKLTIGNNFLKDYIDKHY